MFSTLRYNPQNSEAEVIGGSHISTLNEWGKAPQRLACDRCRSKKLRCSGEKTGCDRCVAARISCVFSGGRTGKRKHLAVQTSSGETSALADNLKSLPPSSASHPVGLVSPKASNCKDASDSTTVTTTHSHDNGEAQVNTATSDLFSSPFDSTTWSLDEEMLITDDTIQDMLKESSSENFENFMAIGGYTIPANFDPDHFSFDSIMPDISNTPAASSSLHKTSSSSISLHSQSDNLRAPRSRDRGNIPAFTSPDTTSSHSDPSNCGCLQLVVILLEELETRNNNNLHDRLDSMLAFHKDALNQCATMVLCSHCTSRSENMMFLAVVCQKLVNLCEAIVNKYQQQALSHGFTPTEKPGESYHIRDTLGQSTNTSKYRSHVFFGDFEIDKPNEWEYMIHALITLQLRNLRTFLTRMKMVANSTLRGAQLKIIEATEKRLGDLTSVLRQCELRSKDSDCANAFLNLPLDGIKKDATIGKNNQF